MLKLRASRRLVFQSHLPYLPVRMRKNPGETEPIQSDLDMWLMNGIENGTLGLDNGWVVWERLRMWSTTTLINHGGSTLRPRTILSGDWRWKSVEFRFWWSDNTLRLSLHLRRDWSTEIWLTRKGWSNMELKLELLDPLGGLPLRFLIEEDRQVMDLNFLFQVIVANSSGTPIIWTMGFSLGWSIGKVWREELEAEVRNVLVIFPHWRSNGSSISLILSFVISCVFERSSAEPPIRWSWW